MSRCTPVAALVSVFPRTHKGIRVGCGLETTSKHVGNTHNHIKQSTGLYSKAGSLSERVWADHCTY